MIKLRAVSEYDELPYYIRNGVNISYVFLFLGILISAIPGLKYMLIFTFILPWIYLIFSLIMKKFGSYILIDTDKELISIKTIGKSRIIYNLSDCKLDMLYSKKLNHIESCLVCKHDKFFIRNAMFINTVKKMEILIKLFKPR